MSATMTMRHVETGPWEGYRIRTARKAGRCQHGHCGNTIKVGDDYIAGEADPYTAGGFAQERYCMAHAVASSEAQTPKEGP